MGSFLDKMPGDANDPAKQLPGDDRQPRSEERTVGSRRVGTLSKRRSSGGEELETMSSHDERARDGSRHAGNRRTGHFRPAARTLILASVSLSLIGCRDPAVPASAPAQADDARAYYHARQRLGDQA